jgi:hypothetical protein
MVVNKCTEILLFRNDIGGRRFGVKYWFYVKSCRKANSSTGTS